MDEDPNAWLLQEFLSLDTASQRRFLTSLIKNLGGPHLRLLHELIAPGLPLDPFSQLAPNVSMKILKSFTDIKSVIRVGRVCRSWNATSSRNATLWNYYLEHMPLSKHIRRTLPNEPSIDVVQNAFKRENMLKSNWMEGRYRRIHFACHGSSVVTCLEIDEDKSRIFTGSEDNTVCIWGFEEGHGIGLGSLIGHRGGVWAMKVIPGRNVLITGSTDRSLIVWDLNSMTMQHQMVGHVSTIRCLEVWNDFAISGSRDGTVRIWNWTTGDLLHHITAHSSSVRCLSLFSDGYFVSGSYDNTCALWDIRTGQLIQRFVGHTDKIYSVACSKDRIFSGSMDGTVRMWAPSNAHAVRILYGHRGLVGNLMVQGNLITSASTDGAIKIWDAQKQQPVLNLPTAHSTSITTIAMNRWALVTGSEGFCRLWDPITGNLLADYTFTAFSYSPSLVWRVAMGEFLCAVAYRSDGVTYLDIFDYSTPHNYNH